MLAGDVPYQTNEDICKGEITFRYVPFVKCCILVDDGIWTRNIRSIRLTKERRLILTSSLLNAHLIIKTSVTFSLDILNMENRGPPKILVRNILNICSICVLIRDIQPFSRSLEYVMTN